MNKLNAAVRKTFTAFLVVLTVLVSSVVMKPISVSAETKGWESAFSAQIVEEGKKMVGKVKYDLDGKWYDNGKGYSTSNLSTECNGYVRRILVNALYAVEGKGVELPSAYQGLKTVTTGGLDLIGRLNAINSTVTQAPSNLQNADSEPNMARVNAFLDNYAAGTVVYFEKPNGDRHWAIYAGKENGVHMAIHSSPKKRGADTGWNHAFYEPFEELWLAKGSGYAFKSVYNPIPLPSLGNIELEKADSNGTAVQGAVFNFFMEDGTQIYRNQTTNSAGKIIINDLEAGDYYALEQSVPAPLIVDKTTKWHFTVEPDKTAKVSNGTNGKIVNEIAQGHIQVVKVSNHNTPVAGVVFEIRNSGGSVVDTITTNAQGIATSKSLPLGNYTYKEIQVPSGIVLDSTVKNFTLSYKDQNTPVVEVKQNVINKHQRSDLLVTKTENDWDGLQAEFNGKAIEGVTFSLKARTDIYEGSTRVYFAGELIGERVTDKAGQVKFENLPIGLYDLQEVATADGYILNDAIIPVSIVYDADKPTVEITLTEKTVTNQIKYGSVELVKTSCENNCTTNELLPGATFELRRSSDDKVLGTYVTDANGRIIVQDLRYSTNKGYYFIETKAPEGFFTSDKKIYFDITEHHTRVYQTASNKPVKAHIQLVKIDEDGTKLEGVEFRVRSLETNDFITVDVVKGNKVEKQTKWTTDAKGEIFVEGLIDYGNYELVETKALEGYVPLNSIRFTIDAEQDYIDLGTIIGKSLDLGTIINEFIKSPILIKKIDKLTGEPIPGTVFGVYKDKELVGTYTTGADGTVLTDIYRYGVYTVEEQTVPFPYVINPDKKTQEVNITEHNIVYEVVFENVPTKIEIFKVDKNTGEPIEGVVFEVYNAANELVTTLTTDENGYASVEGENFGEYTIKEVSIKAPYVINPDAQTQTVNLSEDNHTQSVTFENDIARGQIIVEKKDAKNLKPVAGAKYAVINAGDLTLEDITANFKWIKDDLGNVIAIEDLGIINISDILYGEFTTDKNGLIDLGNLDLSRYFIVELESPYGYQLDPQVYEINIEYQDQNTPIVKHTLAIKEARAKGIIQVAKKDSVSKKLIDFAKKDLFKAEQVNADGTRSLILPESVEGGVFTYIVDLLEIYEFREANPPVGYNKSKEVIRLDTHKPVEDRIYYVEYFNDLTPVVYLPPTGLVSYTPLGFGLVGAGVLFLLAKKRKEEHVE